MAFSTTTAATSQEGRRTNPVGGRLAGLARAVEGSRGSSRFDVRQLLLASGATCMGLGIVAIVLGWYGAAHSTYLFQEVPYLISGGLLGVALVAGGGFLFFASWLVRMLEDNHRHASRVEQTLARVDQVLGAIAADALQAARAEESASGAEEMSTRIGSTPSYTSTQRPRDGTGDGYSGGWEVR